MNVLFNAFLEAKTKKVSPPLARSRIIGMTPIISPMKGELVTDNDLLGQFVPVETQGSESPLSIEERQMR